MISLVPSIIQFSGSQVSFSDFCSVVSCVSTRLPRPLFFFSCESQRINSDLSRVSLCFVFWHILTLSIFHDSSLQNSLYIFIKAPVSIFLRPLKESAFSVRHVVDLFIEGGLLCDGTNSTERLCIISKAVLFSGDVRGINVSFQFSEIWRIQLQS